MSHVKGDQDITPSHAAMNMGLRIVVCGPWQGRSTFFLELSATGLAYAKRPLGHSQTTWNLGSLTSAVTPMSAVGANDSASMYDIGNQYQYCVKSAIATMDVRRKTPEADTIPTVAFLPPAPGLVVRTTATWLLHCIQGRPQLTLPWGTRQSERHILVLTRNGLVIRYKLVL